MSLSQFCSSKKNRCKWELCCPDHVGLEGEFANHNEPEQWVVEQGFEDIHLVCIHYSCVDLVEQIHQNESVEYHSVHNHSLGCKTITVSQRFSDEIERLIEEDQSAKAGKDQEDKELVSYLTKNGAPHFNQDNLVLLADASHSGFFFLLFVFSFLNLLVLFRWLGADTDCTKDVHNQVGPQ